MTLRQANVRFRPIADIAIDRHGSLMTHRLMLLLFATIAVLGAVPLAARTTNKGKELALIENQCGLKKGTITLVGDQIRFQPMPNADYKSVDCALGRLLRLRGLKDDLSNLGFVGNEARPDAAMKSLSASAEVATPANATKLSLIRRYLRAIGRQDQLDTGSFLERYAIPFGPMSQALKARDPTETLKGGFEKRMRALTNAYAKYRVEYQQAYEDHVNWEFTEAELTAIVGFLESPVGKHFLDGRTRMDAYVGTNTEDLEAQIVREAIANLAR